MGCNGQQAAGLEYSNQFGNPLPDSLNMFHCGAGHDDIEGIVAKREGIGAGGDDIHIGAWFEVKAGIGQAKFIAKGTERPVHVIAAHVEDGLSWENVVRQQFPHGFQGLYVHMNKYTMRGVLGVLKPAAGMLDCPYLVRE